MAVLLLLLRASVVIAAALLIAHALRRRSADVRADLWRATFVALAILPLATVFLPGLPWLPALETSAAATTATPAASPATDLPELALLDRASPGPGINSEGSSGGSSRGAARVADVDTTPAVAVPSLSFDWIDGLLLLWLGGVLLQVLRLVSGLRRAAVIARNGEHSEDAGRVGIVTSPDATSAFVWDPRPFARPVVVLPRSGSDDPTWRSAVLAHELHHVQRGDGAFLPFATLIAALYWPTPLARIALRRLRLAIEHAADDAVVRAGVRPTDYASGLVALASAPVLVPVPTMAAWGTVTSRVEALLDARVDRRATSRRARFGALLAVLMVCAPIATLTSAANVQEEDQEVEIPVDPKEARRQMRERALDALVAMQHEETGAWRGDVGFKLNNGWNATNQDVPHVGVTGLAVEALLLAGVQIDESARGQSLERGIEFLLDQQDDSGYFSANGTRMRSHAHAMRALAIALSDNHHVLPMVEDAVAFTIKAQSPETGGWRFVPGASDSDVVETAHQFDALMAGVHHAYGVERRTARRTLKGSAGSFQAAKDYVRAALFTDRGSPHYGAYRFQAAPQSRVTVNTTAAGMRVIQKMQYNDLPIWKVSVRQLRGLRSQRASELTSSAEHFLTWDAELIADRAFDSLEPGSGDPVTDPAEEWRAGTARWLTDNQLPDGSWKCSTGPGDAYFTAIGCVLLAEND